jgi:glycosyltransferase involved in cell wall biosynthesis
MRIALVSQEYPPETAKGGLGTQTYLKAHGLIARGHEVHVISQTNGPAVQQIRDGDVRVIRTPGFYPRMPVYTEPAGWLTYSAEVAAVLAQRHAESPFDLVDFAEWGAEGYVHLLNQTASNHIPSVIHLHGPLVMLAHALGWPEIDSEFYRIGTEMEKTCLRLADAVFSSSQCTVNWCRRFYELASGEVPVIHAGVDTRHFSPKPVPKEARPTVIFVGRMARNKGVESLVEACCRLTPDFPDLQLRMLGAGEDGLVANLRRTTADRGCPALLDMRGFTRTEELPEQLSRAHVFAAPSVYEGGPGFVYLEAMACGLPAIGCEGSGVAEIISHGHTGILVPPADADALAAALRDLLTDPEERAMIGSAARKFVLAHAERENCLDRIEAFYRQVAQRAK